MLKALFSKIFLLSMLLPFLINLPSKGQTQLSIHAEESQFYKTHAWPVKTVSGTPYSIKGRITGNRRVFGYHPYWMNNSWSGYQWNLLTDLCYFSYEVEPATGFAKTTNNFETAPVIDTALSHEVKVHLCVTLFSDHSTFFGNMQARRNLCSQLAEKVKQQGIHGINIDFEAVPSSQAIALTSFMQQLSQYLDSVVPGTQLSMATPAVNWSNTFDLPALASVCDFFMVMAYDYYWTLSQSAGPVAPIYPMENGYLYGVARTVQYYLNEGIPEQKIVLGVPYYGRTWPVQSATAPSATRGAGSAVTYRSVKLNTSLFNWQTRHYQPASRATYYAYLANGWNQCFIDELPDLRMKYDLVNAYGLGGIGIWALGYDEGFSELWELIADAFGSDFSMSCSDTLYDASGPAYPPTVFSKKPMFIRPRGGSPLSVSFPTLSLTDVRIDVFESCDTTGQPIASLAPGDAGFSFNTDSTCICILPRPTSSHPKADFSVTWRCPSAGFTPPSNVRDKILVYPNPASHQINITLSENLPNPNLKICLLNPTGAVVFSFEANLSGNSFCLELPSHLPSGLYLIRIENSVETYNLRFILTR